MFPFCSHSSGIPQASAMPAKLHLTWPTYAYGLGMEAETERKGVGEEKAGKTTRYWAYSSLVLPHVVVVTDSMISQSSQHVCFM